MVVKDRLSKAAILIPMQKIESQDVAWAFVREVYRHHSLPLSITSDRGPQFASAMWGDVCRLLGIRRNLSTAYHPQTDGTTERANSDIEVVVRVFCNNDQDNWATLCPILELMLNSRTNTSTGVSPFFLQHGYHNTPFSQQGEQERADSCEIAKKPTHEKAKDIVQTITSAAEWAIAAMSYAQQEQERQANKSRKPAPTYKVGDWVWLDLRDVRTTRASKKLDWKSEKYQVSRVRDPYWVELAVPWETKSFHVDKIRPATTDPLPSQQTNDLNPAAVVVRDKDEQEEHLEWQVESITSERTRRGTKQYLVKWVGFQEATWEPERNLANTAALQSWLTRTQAVRSPSSSLQRRQNRQQRKLSRPHQRTPPQQREHESLDHPYEDEDQEELLLRH